MYDFVTLRSRDHWGAEKWEARTEAEKKKGIVPLSVADMEFVPAPEIVQAIVEAAQNGVYGYTGPDAAYREAVKGFLHRHHGLVLNDEEIVPISGVVPALYSAVRAFTQPGDGIIIQTPVYPPFYAAARINDRVLIENPLRRTGMVYEMDFEDLEKKCSDPRAKLLILCSPHNPVCRVWTRRELETLERITSEHGVLVLADEIHSDLILQEQHISYPSLNDRAKSNCLLFTSPSKTFNLAGLQLANALVFDPLLRKRYKEQLEKEGWYCIPFFGRAALLAAYTKCDAWLEQAIGQIRENGHLLQSFFRQHLPNCPIAPMQGTYLAWIDMRALGLDRTNLEKLNRSAGLLLDEGYIFGKSGEGFERINLALPRAELEKALLRWRDAIKALQS